MVSRIRRVAINSILLGLQQIVVNLLSIVVVAYIARKLGDVDYGVFSLGFTFTGFFTFLGHLGLRTLTVREVAKDLEHANYYLGKIIPARLFLIALMTIVIPITAIIFDYDKKTIIIVAIAALATMFEQLSRIINDIFQAHEEMGKVAFRDIFVRLVTGIASIVVLYCGYGLLAVSWLYVLGAIFGFLYNALLYNNRFTLPTFQVDYIFIWKNIKEGLSYMVLGMASSLYAHVDVLIISKMLDMQSVGVYNVSANLFYRLSFIADAVATAAFPAIAQLYWHNKIETNNVLSKSLHGILVISMPMAVGGWMLADDIIVLIYGGGFALSANVFRILISSVPFMFLSMQFSYALGAIKLQIVLVKVVSFLLLMNIILNLLLIPINGIQGSAYSTLITEIIGFLILLKISLNYFCITGTLKIVKILFLPIIIMILIVYFTSDFGVVFAIIFGAFSYIAFLFLIGKGELSSFFSAIKFDR